MTVQGSVPISSHFMPKNDSTQPDSWHVLIIDLPLTEDVFDLVFQVPIECDDVDCSAQLLVHVWLNSNTTDEQVLEQRMAWLFVGVTCPEGDAFPEQEWK